MYKFIEKLTKRNKDLLGNPPATLACIGDSVTQGCFELLAAGNDGFKAVTKPGSAYPIKLQKMLQTICPDAQLNLINAGINGDSTSYGLERLQRDVLNFSPDLVTVSYGLNDCHAGEDGIELYASNLGKIFDKCIESGAEVIFMTQNCMNTYVKYDKDYITYIPSLYDGEKATAEIQNSGLLKKYYDAAKAECKKRNIAVCDCYDLWDKMYKSGVDVTALLINNINHPTEDMHWLFAYELFRTIING